MSPEWGRVSQAEIDAAVAAHAADLDAHTKDIGEELLVGNYHCGFPISSISAIPCANNYVNAVFFWLARKATFDRIAIEVTTQQVASHFRLGIYNDNGSLAPGTLLLDAGVVDTSSTGIKAITINQQLTKGIYWLAFISDVNDVAIYGAEVGFSGLGFAATDFSLPLQSVYKSQAYGALPDPFGTPTGWSSIRRLICLRLASRD